jgi:hypothetical protein
MRIIRPHTALFWNRTQHCRRRPHRPIVSQWKVHFACALALLVATLPGGAYAAETVVGNNTPQGCTEGALRAAVAQGGTIRFNCGPAPHTIMLTDDLVISKDTVIDGGGPQQGGLITLSGGGRTRLISTGNALDRTQDVRAALTIRNLTLRDGREPIGDTRGGAIQGGWRSPITIINSRLENNDATAGATFAEHSGGAVTAHETTLTIIDSTFVGNRGLNGGAINNLLSTLDISGSVFVDNDAKAGGSYCIPNNCFGYGGAIYTDGASWPLGNGVGGQIRIRTSSFVGNRAAGQGGGAFLFVYPPDTVLVEDSLFSDNSVVADLRGEAFGGGLRQGNGDLTVRNTLFLNNLARSQGGAFWRGEVGAASFTNVTLVGNRAVQNDATATGGLGGAVAGNSTAGSFACTNCTIANNLAGFQGGAIWGLGPSMTLKNSIIANNRANNDGNPWNIKHNCGGNGSQASDGGGNVEFPQRNLSDNQDVHCTAGVTVGDPRLAAPAANGGATLTMALQTGSVALGRGAGCPATDQRGAVRSTPCDSGAFQSGANAPPITLPAAPTLRLIDHTGGPLLDLAWNGVPGATRYELEVGAGAPAAPQRVTTRRTAMTIAADKGAIVLRVRACNPLGCSAFSNVVQSTVETAPQRIFLPLLRN